MASLDPGSRCVHSTFALILFLQPPTTSFPGHSPPLSSFPAWCTSLQKFVTHVGRSSHSIQGANICSEVKPKPCERVPLGLDRFAGRWAMCWCTQGLKDGALVHATEARRQPAPCARQPADFSAAVLLRCYAACRHCSAGARDPDCVSLPPSSRCNFFFSDKALLPPLTNCLWLLPRTPLCARAPIRQAFQLRWAGLGRAGFAGIC